MPDKSTTFPIEFHFLVSCAYPREKRRLKKFLTTLFKKETTALDSLTYVFCSDQYLLGINQQFLQHDYYTDIISFNLAAKGEPVIGEIYISIDRVRDNAKVLDQSLNRELHRVIFHGALHLCGYKDKSAADIKLMRFKEDQQLISYFK